MCFVLDARTATDHFPGIGRYVFNLARAMIPLLNKNEQLILLRDPHQSSPWNLAALTSERVQIVGIPLSPFSVRQQWLLPNLLRRSGTDVYHSPYYLMSYRPGVPTVLTVYDLIPLLYPQHVSAQARLLFRWTTSLALRTAAHVVAISQATRHDFLDRFHISPAKISTIHLAPDPTFQPLPALKITTLRTRLNLPELYVLYLGSNKPHKNLLRLLEAWARLQPQPYTLLIAGVWDNRYPEAKARIRELGLAGSVRFLGPILEKDMPTLYSGATAFVFPSEHEGFGLPVLEAMACGVPVACSNTSSLPEIVGEAALTFNPVQVESIASALGQLLNNPTLRAHLQEQGLRQSTKFSWQQTAQATLEVYRMIMSP
ncbi:MAG: glycosyltransferase family 4 protein [Anaerolineae bacterium]|nr:glycosyltransferase family 4 protein [Anaerolineae bacterium]